MTADPENRLPDEFSIANVIKLFPDSHESEDPESLTDMEIIELQTSVWLHPGVSAHNLPEKILADMARDDDPWHTRLRKLTDSAPFIELYEECLKDEVFQSITHYMQSSKEFGEQLRTERKAAMALAELCVISLQQSGSSERIGRVFAKFPSDFTIQP